MARPKQTPDEQLFVLTSSSLWCNLLVPASRVTEVAQLLSSLESVNDEYLQGTTRRMYYTKGQVDITFRSVPNDAVFAENEKEAKAYVDAYNTTVALRQGEAYEGLALTLEDFRNSQQTKVTE